MEKMTFTTDRTSLTEGEIIEITWDCHEAERVELTIDNGYKATAIALDLTGTKRFRLNRSRGKTKLTLTALVNGHSYSKTIKVKVTEMPTTHAKTVDDKGHTISAGRQWWQNRTLRWRTAWQAMTPVKQLATKILVAIAALLLLSMLQPRLMPLGLVAIVIWLVFVITRHKE